MDLIYATNQKVDVGVLENYTFDLAFGIEENNFTCEIRLQDHCCYDGYMFYIEETEYGGIIDNITPDTNKKTVTYGGRTWHGVLENKVLSPDAGEDYLYLSGEANEVLQFIIDRIGLSDLFSASTEDSGIEIVDYQIRYRTGYTAIREMLYQFGGKLKITFSKGYVVLSAVPYIDYSQDEEWDSTQLTFKIERNYKATNHLICLGRGDLKDRKVIHLFTDENGGLQPYTITDNPVKNADYILDTSSQLLTGEDEITEIYDYSNAEDTTNYVLLEAEPTNWQNTYVNYYAQTDDDEYKALESTTEDVYTLQIQQPYDWNTNYKDYYAESGSSYVSVATLSTTVYTVQTKKPSNWTKKYATYYTSSHSAVGGVTHEYYREQTKKPADWKKNYGNYYYYWSDGISFEYKKVSGVTKYKYFPQTLKPTDWETNYKAYYSKNKKDSGYTALTALKKWEKSRFYTKESYSVSPKWGREMYYTYKKIISAPIWNRGTYYTKSVQSVPTWTSGTYYTKTTETFIPEFVTDTYFEQFIDNYADLVENGIEKLKESYNCDSIDITLNARLEQSYDINDIVGASEDVTGIMVWQPITKKIVKINYSNYKEQITYEIGG